MLLIADSEVWEIFWNDNLDKKSDTEFSFFMWELLTLWHLNPLLWNGFRCCKNAPNFPEHKINCL